MNLAVAVSADGPKTSAWRSRSRELAPSAATTMSYPAARRSSASTSVEKRISTPALAARRCSRVSSVFRSTAAMPLPWQTNRSPRSRTSMGSQCTPCSVSAVRSTGSAAWIRSSVASENTTPKPKVSSARLRSNTVTSRSGTALFASAAANRPPGPPPRIAIRTGGAPWSTTMSCFTPGNRRLTHMRSLDKGRSPGTLRHRGWVRSATGCWRAVGGMSAIPEDRNDAS